MNSTMPLDLGWWTLRDGRRALLTWWPGPGTLVIQGPDGDQILAVIHDEDEVRRRLDGWQDHCDQRDALGWLAGRLEGVR